MASRDLKAAFEKGIERLARVSFQCGWCERPNSVDLDIDAVTEINAASASELVTMVREVAHEQLDDPEAFVEALAKRAEERLGAKS